MKHFESASVSEMHSTQDELTLAAGSDALAVSAIIPVYNGARFIAKALESVLTQTVPVKKVFVIDDCSTDGTAGVVRHYAESDNRVVLLVNPANCGPAHSRNRALELADTPLAAFLDADDWWLPMHVETVQRGFRQFPSATVVYARTATENRIASEGSIASDALLMRDPLTSLLDENPIAQSCTVVRVADVRAVGGYVEAGRYAEDYDLWVRLALRGCEIVDVVRVTCVRMQHEHQVSANNAGRMYQSAWRTRRLAVERHYGDVHASSHEVIESLLRSIDRDIAAALHTRRRDVVRLVLELTAWVPGSSERIRATERLLGWRWAFWRGAAFLYDAAPAGLRERWRQARQRTPGN